MAETPLTMRQQAALLTLMSEARELTNAQLKQLAGVEIDRGDRERLIGQGLLLAERDRNAYVYQLTAQGQARCEELMHSGEPPQRSGSAAGALFVYMRNVQRNLSRLDLPTDEPFFQPDPEKRIRAAYHRVARRPGAAVSLAEIRKRLVGMPPAEVDATLDLLITRPDIRLLSEENRKALTEEDHKAAVSIGGQLKHMMAIEVE